MNKKKTNDGELITTYECDKQTIVSEWLMTKSLYSRLASRENNHEVIAYPIRQSFKPGEIDPVLANKLGDELVGVFTKGRFEYIVCTHTDKVHIQNYIIFNSTAIDRKRSLGIFWEVQRQLADYLIEYA